MNTCCCVRQRSEMQDIGRWVKQRNETRKQNRRQQTCKKQTILSENEPKADLQNAGKSAGHQRPKWTPILEIKNKKKTTSGFWS